MYNESTRGSCLQSLRTQVCLRASVARTVKRLLCLDARGRGETKNPPALHVGPVQTTRPPVSKKLNSSSICSRGFGSRLLSRLMTPGRGVHVYPPQINKTPICLPGFSDHLPYKLSVCSNSNKERGGGSVCTIMSAGVLRHLY